MGKFDVGKCFSEAGTYCSWGLKMLGKTYKELRHLRIEDDDARYILHGGVVVISQGCAKL
jgi:hypothetical protein